MAAYCNKSSIDQESVAFMFDGVRLRGEQTPGDVDMEDQDEIQVSVMHTSGPELAAISADCVDAFRKVVMDCLDAQ